MAAGGHRACVPACLGRRGAQRPIHYRIYLDDLAGLNHHRHRTVLVE
jgi:hypothetical protein